MGQGQGLATSQAAPAPAFAIAGAAAPSRPRVAVARWRRGEEPPSAPARQLQGVRRSLEWPLAALIFAAGSRCRRSRRALQVAAAASPETGEVTISTRRTEAIPTMPEDVDLELDFATRAQDNLMKVGKEHQHGVTVWNDHNWEYWDVAKIFVKAGNGGNGCKSFHRELNMPLMGPDGGDGGLGGSVYLLCQDMANNLNSLKESTHYYAQNGELGRGCMLGGKYGKDKYVRVPPGTVVHVRQQWVDGNESRNLPGEKMLIRKEEISTRKLVGELTRPGQILRVAKGGKGGKGNASFKTHQNTAPVLCTNGEKGPGRWLELELKITADIGLIGVPNAGKSSLLHAVTDKEPLIAAYPFSTTKPNLGQYKADIHGGLTLCDVPGLIDGASEGRGMGFTFLRHIERCRTLIHVVSGDSEDPLGDFESIQNELRRYSTEVANKPQVVVVNKSDIPEVKEYLPELMAALRKRCGHSRVFDISAATRHNTDELMRRVYKWHSSIVKKDWEFVGAPSDDAELIIGRRNLGHLGHAVDEVALGEVVELDKAMPTGRRNKSAFQARVEWDVIEEAWRMIHPEVEKAAELTNWLYEDGYGRLNKICKATGMTEALKAAGIKDGEAVIVHTHKFLYSPSMDGQDSRMLIYEMDLVPETLR